MNHVIGVDLGGTKVAAARVGADGALGEVFRAPSCAGDGPAAVMRAIASVVTLAAAGEPIAGIGIGTAGAVDPGRGCVVSSTSVFADWAGYPILDGLRAELSLGADVPMTVCNDVDAHALGETWLGAGRGRAAALMVAVGTGVGGAVVLGETLRAGAHHVAGEIAHVPARGAEHLMCPCGRPGHLEAMASGPGIHRHYLSLGGDPSVPDTRALVTLAKAGDALAKRAINEGAACLGRVVAGLVTVLDPDVVIIGGGVPQAGAVWWHPFEDACRAELIDVLQNIPLLPAELGENAAILGAAKPLIEREGRK